jgi:hypothetical protein
MKVAHWQFAALLGVGAALLQAISVAIMTSRITVATQVFALAPYILFFVAIPYLATRPGEGWWATTALTVSVAWLMFVVLSVPASFLVVSLARVPSDTYFFVGPWSNRLLYLILGGVVVLLLLSAVLGGLARRLHSASAS